MNRMEPDMDRYVMNRADYFKQPDLPYMASRVFNVGSLWIDLWLTEQEVMLLFCKGVMVRKTG